MAELSLRQYLQQQGFVPGQGIREYCAPSLGAISLRSLMSAPRIIHISDLHFVASDHTWIWESGVLTRIDEDSRKKAQDILTFLINQRRVLGTDVIIITGDLTDRGGEGDYQIVRDFIEQLRENSFVVYAIPGNHDYCWIGNLIFQDIFKAAHALDAVAIAAKVKTKSPKAIETAIASEIAKTINAQLAFKVPDYIIPKAIMSELLELFSVVSSSIVGNSDTVDNNQRRQRFIQYITPDVSNEYPRFISLANGYLVLLDSMQAELNEHTGDYFAQGKLGKSQLLSLKTWLDDHQSEREAGKKVIVSIHHSPFHLKDWTVPDGFSIGKEPDDFTLDYTCGLDDAVEFLEIVKNQVDCVLFGHISPANVPQIGGGEQGYFSSKELNLGIPLINCENLILMNNSYPITILDLGTYQRLVYQTDGTIVERSWGHPSSRVSESTIY